MIRLDISSGEDTARLIVEIYIRSNFLLYNS